MIDYSEILLFFIEHPFLSFIVLFVEFVITMKLYHKVDNKLLHAVLFLWFIPQDIAANMVFASIIGWELPREWTVTARMKRWKKLEGYTGIKRWRWSFATKLCKQLNKYDAGHC